DVPARVGMSERARLSMVAGGEGLVCAARIRSIRAVAPEAAAWLARAWAATERLDADHLALLRARVLAGLGIAAAASDPGPDPVAQALARVADEFVRFVPEVPTDAVAVLHEHLGRGVTRELIEALWVYDQAARLRLAHAALFGAHDGGVDTPVPSPGEVAIGVGEANAGFHHAVMLLGSMGLETTELVRLRAGFHHRCRSCRSVRLVAGGVVVADEPLVQRMAADETTTGFTDAQRAALRYSDLYMSDPGRIDLGVRAWLGAHFSRDEIVELTLDLSAWNWQKVLVALGLDRPADPTRLVGIVIDGDDGTVSRIGPLPAANNC
ncbi:MAG: carboxymuconolactone decarboxylase family protein, partial [Sciscionella sp.]